MNNLQVNSNHGKTSCSQKETTEAQAKKEEASTPPSMRNKKKFVVGTVYTKETGVNKIEIVQTLSIHYGINSHEAIGRAVNEYNDIQSKNGYSLGNISVIEVSDEKKKP